MKAVENAADMRAHDEAEKGPICIIEDGETQWVPVNAAEHERFNQTDNRQL